METKQEINYKIDWVSADEKAVQDRREYFKMLRGFLQELDEYLHSTGDELDGTEIETIYKKWNVHFVDIDDFPRVNIDKPRI